MPHSLPRALVRAGCLLVMPAAVASCAHLPRSVASDRPPTAASTSTLEVDSGDELHPDGTEGQLSEDEWHEPLAVGGQFLQQLLKQTDGNPGLYATTRLASELADQTPDASSRGDRGKAVRVASVRMLHRFSDWATEVAIVEHDPGSSATTTVEEVDVYVLTLTRQQDDRWLVADLALR